MESEKIVNDILASSPLITRYFQYLTKVRNYAEGTARVYILSLGYYRAWLAARDIDYRAADYDTMVAFLTTMSDEGLAHSTMCCRLYAVRSFYKWLTISFGLSFERLMLVQGPKVEKNLPEVLTQADVENLLAVIPDSTRSGIRDRAIFELMYYTGVRVSEVTGLQLSNLRLSEGFAIINGKGSKQRIVMLEPNLVALLEKWLNLRAGMKIDPSARDLVFVDLISYGAISRYTIAHNVARYGKAAGIAQHVHPHMLRHTFATHMLDGGADLVSIKALMGHKSIATTERYIHVSTAHLKAQMAQYHPHGSLRSKIS